MPELKRRDVGWQVFLPDFVEAADITGFEHRSEVFNHIYRAGRGSPEKAGEPRLGPCIDARLHKGAAAYAVV
jgi:hypothetical protein